jgi:cell division protein FtsQ
MAKQRVNRLDKQKKPIKVVVQQLGRKLPFLLLIVAIAAIGYNLHRSHLFDPKINWTIDEKLNRSDAHYEQLIAPLLGNKYLINLAELKDSIEAEAWVSNAQIKRLFWNKIDIKLSTHIIAMRWQDNGYISTKGVLFRPETLEISQTPLAVVDEDKVLKFYKDYQLYQMLQQ